jgi:hypothetical protein
MLHSFSVWVAAQMPSEPYLYGVLFVVAVGCYALLAFFWRGVAAMNDVSEDR